MKTNTDLNLLFEELYSAYHDMIFGFLMGLTGGDRELSEDLTQETFFQAWCGIERFRGKCSFSTWLCQISKNCWLKYLRKNKNAPLPMDFEMLCDLPQTAKPHSDAQRSGQPEEAALGRERYADLRAALLALPAKQRDIVIYRLYYDLSYDEIERLTGTKKDTARVLCQRGRVRLSNALRQE